MAAGGELPCILLDAMRVGPGDGGDIVGARVTIIWQHAVVDMATIESLFLLLIPGRRLSTSCLMLCVWPIPIAHLFSLSLMV